MKALRLASAFSKDLKRVERRGTSAEMWLNLQSQYDLRLAQRTTWPEIKLRIKARKAA